MAIPKTKELRIGNITLDGRFILAPLAGYTDYGMRSICREHGASLVVTELVSSPALSRNVKKCYQYMTHKDIEHPISLQIFGSEADDFKRAIENHADKIMGKYEDNHYKKQIPFSFIDINMGCPTRKVVRSGSGAKLLSDVNKMVEIVKAVKSVSPLPFSVKIRLGYSKTEGGEIERLKALIEQEPAFIAIHGRYATEMYKGTADWDMIARLKQEAGDFIIVGNGDIKNKESAIKAFEVSNVDAIMIGRAAVGNPWIFSELNSIFDSNEKSDSNIDYKPSREQVVEVLKRHVHDACENYGDSKGVHFMRKFLLKYLGRIPGISHEYKLKFVKVDSEQEVHDLLKEMPVE